MLDSFCKSHSAAVDSAYSCLSAYNHFYFLSGFSAMVHKIQKEQYFHIYDIAVSLKGKSTFLPFVG